MQSKYVENKARRHSKIHMRLQDVGPLWAFSPDNMNHMVYISWVREKGRCKSEVRRHDLCIR